MVLYIVRHGQTNWNSENRFQGAKDIDLNSSGIKQAELLCEKLSNISIDFIYASPLIRATHTANIINNNHNAALITDNRIIERSLGDLEGKLMNDSKYNDIWNIILDLKNPNSTCYNVETISSMINRIYNFLKDLINKYKDTNTTILLVAHGGIMQIMLLLLGYIPTSTDLKNYHIENCAFYKIDNPNVIEITTDNNNL